MRKPLFIAEVKTFSPFGYSSNKSWDELFEVAADVGEIISIHTDKRWGGSWGNLSKARNLTNKPILAKGIHNNDNDILKAINLGADYVLTVGRIPNIKEDFFSKLIIEPYTLNQLIEFKQVPEMKFLWNSRDLTNGKQKTENFTEARNIYNGWLCQASNIKCCEDINVKADAFLVGEHLLEIVNKINR